MAARPLAVNSALFSLEGPENDDYQFRLFAIGLFSFLLQRLVSKV